MMKTAERRMVLLNILCERRKDTVDNLAFELQVSKATILQFREKLNDFESSISSCQDIEEIYMHVSHFKDKIIKEVLEQEKLLKDERIAYRLGKKVEVSEEVYRAYVRPIRAEQRKKRREWKCPVPGKKGNLVRCQEDCSKCKYALAGNNARGNILSLDTFKEEGVEILDRDFDLEVMYIESEERTSNQERLHKAILQLTPRQQEMIRMIYFEGKTQEEVAWIFEIDGSSVRHAMQRIYARLKKILEEN